MKSIATLIYVLAVSMVFSSTAILAADNYPAQGGDYGNLLSSHNKNECLLVAKNCATDSSTVQQRVIDLRNEIAKGLDVYTFDELKALKEQLNWIKSDSSNEFI